MKNLEREPLIDTTTYLDRPTNTIKTVLTVILVLLYCSIIILLPIAYFSKPQKPKSKTMQQLEVERLELEIKILKQKLK